MMSATAHVPNNLSHAQLARITATRCCVCRAPLTDAESVEHGIGPTCSRRYYNPQYVPTDAQVMVALGHLAASELPDHIVDGFLNLVDNTHVKARLGCNLLVYWASAHYDDRDEVFKCSKIIRALGYEELADKLEADRTTATVRYLPDKLEVFVPDKFTLERDMRAIPGVAKMLEADGSQVKQGRKIGWTVPVEQTAHFETVLGVHCGGELACGTKGIYTIPRKRWADLQVFRQPKNAPAPAGQTPTATLPDGGVVQILPTSNGRLEIHSPFNAAFKDALKAQVPYKQRSWTGTCWAVSASYLETVKTLIKLHYGVTL